MRKVAIIEAKPKELEDLLSLYFKFYEELRLRQHIEGFGKSIICLQVILEAFLSRNLGILALSDA